MDYLYKHILTSGSDALLSPGTEPTGGCWGIDWAYEMLQVGVEEPVIASECSCYSIHLSGKQCSSRHGRVKEWKADSVTKTFLCKTSYSLELYAWPSSQALLCWWIWANMIYQYIISLSLLGLWLLLGAIKLGVQVSVFGSGFHFIFIIFCLCFMFMSCGNFGLCGLCSSNVSVSPQWTPPVTVS